MPTVEQLPAAVAIGATDQMVIDQAGTTMSTTVGLLMSQVQPALTLAPGALLGRVSTTVGAPEAINLGTGLTMAAGVLSVADTTYAPLDSPAFTGTPTAPTPSFADNSNALATTAFVQSHASGSGGAVTLTGDVLGSGAGTIATHLPAITAPGSFAKVVVNAKGQVTGSVPLVGSDVAGLDVSATTVTTVAGNTPRSLAARAADRINVLDFGAVADGVTDSSAAINAAIAAASAAANGGEVFLPSGTYYVNGSVNSVRLASDVTLRGAGIGATTIIYDDTGPGNPQPGITNAPFNIPSPAVANVTISDLTVQGMRASNVNFGQPLIYFNNATNIVIENVEVRESRLTGIGLYFCYDAAVRNCHIWHTNGDGIDAWDTPDVIISGNRIYNTGDDSIAVHCSDTTPLPVRSGVLVVDNVVQESNGIKVLGPKTAVIANNVLKRMMSYGIYAAIDTTQGDTAHFGLRVTDNVIADVFQRGDLAGNTNREQYYIRVGGTRKTAGTLASAPGVPVPGTGVVTDFYGTGLGYWYVSGSAHGGPGGGPNNNIPNPGDVGIIVTGNTLLRTLPAVTAYSQWGYGALQCGQAGTWNGAVTEAMLSTPGIQLLPGLREAIIADNLIMVRNAPYGIGFVPVPGAGNLLDLDYDGVTVSENRIVFATSGAVYAPATVATTQRVRLVGNEFDADPQFFSTARGGNGSWTGTGAPYGVNAPGMSGLTLEGNHFRNLSTPVTSGTGVAIGNFIHANPAAVGYSASNQGVGTLPAAGPDFAYIIETCDPTNANFGKILSPTLFSSAAMPSSGTYVAGHVVNAQASTYVNGQPLLGWKRLTTGSAHVAGTDWAVIYGSTGAPAGGISVPNASLLSGNGTTLAGIALGSGLTLASGTLSAAGGGGSVTSVVAGGLLSGGTITGAGTISLAAPATGLVSSNGTALAPATIGTGLNFSGGTLSATGVGTMTSVVAGGLLSGGTITTSGTISLAAPAAGIVSSNGTSLAPAAIGTGLNFSGGTLSATGSGTVTSVVAGGLLSGGTITGAGTISLAAPSAGLVSSTGTALAPASIGAGLAFTGGTLSNIAMLTVPSASLLGGNGSALNAVSIGAGLALAAGTLSATAGGAGTVTQVIAGTGLNGGTITGAGTISLAAPSSGLVSSNGTVLAPATIGAGLAFSGGTLSNSAVLTVPNAALVAGNGSAFSGVAIGSGLALASGTLSATASGGTVTQVVAGTGLSGGTITGTGTISLAAPAAGVVQSNGTVLSAVTLAGGLTFSSGTLSAAGVAPAAGSGIAVSGTTVSASGAVSNTYTASGTIAITDNLALLNAASAIAMTLASGATDGHYLRAKRFGAGAATLTATIDGVAGSTINMNSASIKEAVELTWNAANSTWLLL